MSTALTLIFWGLLLTFLDVSFERLDLLPDFLGYALVAVGSGRMAAESREMGIARVLSWLLTLLAIARILVGDSGVLEIVCSVTDLALTWFLLSGIVALAQARGLHDLAATARWRRNACIALAITALGIGLLASAAPHLAGLLAVLLGIAWLALLVLVLTLVLRAKRELSGPPPGG